VRQIYEGLKYLFEESVVHGDLRGSNILFDEDENPCICDCGLAFIIEPSEFTSIKTAGPCRWIVPEIMNPPESATCDYGDTDEGGSFSWFTKLTESIKTEVLRAFREGPASQIDARKSTFNNVGRDQYITNNYNYPSPTVEDEADSYIIPDDPSIDHELNKYPPLAQYAQKVVMTTTTLVTTAVAAVADLLEDISDTVKSGIQSITIQKRSVRYSFFC